MKSIKMTKNKKLVFITISVLILAIILAVYFFYKSDGKSKANFRPKPFVEVVQVKKVKIFDRVEALGIAKANNSVDITTNVLEIIDEVKFTDNINVKKGDEIVILQAGEEIAERKAEQLQLKEHIRELKRLKILVRRGAASKQKLDQRKTLMEVSKQKITQINAKIADRVIRAPFDGILGLKNISKGALVRPGDLIVTIDDISKIKIDFFVPAIYLANIRKEMPISAKSEAFKNKIFGGFVSFINSRIEENTGSIKIRAIIDNSKLTLRPGLLLNVTLFKDERSSIMINEEALTQLKDKHYLFVLKDNNKVEKREVKIGTRKDGLVEILNNLKEEEKIISRGVANLQDGSEVQTLDSTKPNQNSL